MRVRVRRLCFVLFLGSRVLYVRFPIDPQSWGIEVGNPLVSDPLHGRSPASRPPGLHPAPYPFSSTLTLTLTLTQP